MGASLSEARLAAAIAGAECFLREQQRRSGGWGYTTHNRDSFVEPTVWAVLALLGRHRPMGPMIDRALEFVLSAQNADGGWPNLPGMASDMTTARAVFALADLRECRSAVSRGADWLLRQELPSGGWGWCYGTTGFIETAAYGIAALSAAGRLTDSERFVEYVQRLQCVDGGWCSHVPAKLGYSQAGQASVTPLGVIALIRLGMRPERFGPLRESLDLVLAWVAQNDVTTPYTIATTLWSLTEAGLALPAAKVGGLAIDRASADGSWRGGVWITAMICHALRRLESGVG